MAKDYTGMKFNRLKALCQEENTNKRHPKWVFRCDCGNIFVAYIDNVVGGKTKSCGCLHSETMKKRNHKHGLARNRLYFIWKTMRQRCSNPNKEHYERYGGRGIRFCKEWDDYAVFYKWAMANGYNDTLSLDRIDNNGNYEPSNCRWVTQKEQMQNTKTTIFLEVNGERHSLSEWADISGTTRTAIYQRLRNGWTPTQAVFGKEYHQKDDRIFIDIDALKKTVEWFVDECKKKFPEEEMGYRFEQFPHIIDKLIKRIINEIPRSGRIFK